MKSLKLAAAAMALAMPGMAMAATDGTLGATSTGSFNASLTVTADTSNYVQIVGLDDIAFTGIVAGFSGASPVQTIYFCLNKNTPGNVSLNIDQPSASIFFGEYNTQLIGAAYLNLGLRTPDNAFMSFSGNSWVGLPATSPTGPNACDASSGSGVAYAIDARVLTGGIPLVEGTYSKTFTLTLAPE
jgi:hypothetical protein